MARPGLFRHRKFSKLAIALRSPFMATGVLETLWSVCGETCDDRVGSAEELAFSIGWTDKRVDIAQALHAAGFLDKHDDGTYSVHDFWDHCPQYVERRRKREDERRGTSSAARPTDATGKPMASQRLDSGKPLSSTLRAEQCSAEQSRAEQHAPAAPLSLTELHATSPREALFEHWRDVAAQHGVLEPLTRTPKECHQAATLLDVHALDALRGAITAFWDSASFDGKRSFGMFANQAPQLVAHVKAGKPYPFGAPPRVAEKAAREAKLDAWTPPAPRQAVAR